MWKPFSEATGDLIRDWAREKEKLLTQHSATLDACYIQRATRGCNFLPLDLYTQKHTLIPSLFLLSFFFSSQSGFQSYDSLRDPHLAGYFKRPTVRSHLVKAGLVSEPLLLLLRFFSLLPWALIKIYQKGQISPPSHRLCIQSSNSLSFLTHLPHVSVCASLSLSLSLSFYVHLTFFPITTN